MSHYLICGLSVVSDAPLPGASATQTAAAESPDVVIRLADLPATLTDPDVIGSTWQAGAGRFLLNAPGLLRLQVNDGREILVAPAAGQTLDDVSPFIFSTGFAALLHQRRRLALHAATVAWRGRAIALCGPTGAGKSTLAAALCRAGGAFIGDDIAAIDFAADGRPMVVADGRRHRLWADAIKQMGLADRQGPAVRRDVQKFHVSSPEGDCLAQAPLAAVVVLRERLPRKTLRDPVMHRLDMVDAAPTLRAEVYRKTLARKLGLDAPLFLQIARLLPQVPVWRLERNFGFDAMDDVVQLILANLDGTGEG